MSELVVCECGLAIRNWEERHHHGAAEPNSLSPWPEELIVRPKDPSSEPIETWDQLRQALHPREVSR